MTPVAPSPSGGRKLSTPVIAAIIAGIAVILVCGACMAGLLVRAMGDPSTTVADDSTAAIDSAQSPTPDAQPLDGSVSATATPSVNVNDTATSASSTPNETVVVPNGVGLDYQSAQDVWRAAGLHVAPAIDALGANRLPVIDSNWVVLSQDLPAGSVVPVGSFITATVKKYTDN